MCEIYSQAIWPRRSHGACAGTNARAHEQIERND